MYTSSSLTTSNTQRHQTNGKSKQQRKGKTEQYTGDEAANAAVAVAVVIVAATAAVISYGFFQQLRRFKAAATTITKPT